MILSFSNLSYLGSGWFTVELLLNLDASALQAACNPPHLGQSFLIDLQSFVALCCEFLLQFGQTRDP